MRAVAAVCAAATLTMTATFNGMSASSLEFDQPFFAKVTIIDQLSTGTSAEHYPSAALVAVQ